MRKLNPVERQILELINRSEQAPTSAQLAEQLNIKSGVVAQVVFTLRARGLVVCRYESTIAGRGELNRK